MNDNFLKRAALLALLLSLALNAGLLALVLRDAAPQPEPQGPPAPQPASTAPAPEPVVEPLKLEFTPRMPLILDATPALRLDAEVTLQEVVTVTALDRNDLLRSRATG